MICASIVTGYILNLFVKLFPTPLQERSHLTARSQAHLNVDPVAIYSRAVLWVAYHNTALIITRVSVTSPTCGWARRHTATDLPQLCQRRKLTGAGVD